MSSLRSDTVRSEPLMWKVELVKLVKSVKLVTSAVGLGIEFWRPVAKLEGCGCAWSCRESRVQSAESAGQVRS